ncbi:hypothetical protein WDW37_03235 [Bdellovibrionota bacterium FG-1]
MKPNQIKMSKKQKKDFDAVGMKDQIQAKLYLETKELDSHELIEFYRKRAKMGPFRKKVA